MKTLRYGDTGESVKDLQRILKSQGYFDGAIGGNFLQLTKAAVVHFQQTHQGENGGFLSPDGIVGPKTWWALKNPSGVAQRSFLGQGYLPHGISGARKTVLEFAYKAYAQNIREIPDGSNKGDGVDQIIQGFGPAPWCCLFVSWVWKEALGYYPLGKQHAHCATFWKEAEKHRFVKGSREPIPGDLFIMIYNGQSGPGHTGIVTNVEPGGQRFNTLEGNTGNRLKHGQRSINQGTLVGFINLFGTHPTFEHKLLTTAALDSSMAGTR